MPSPRFFSALPIPRLFEPGTPFEVSEAIARHLQVLRLAEGDAITLFDGTGGEFAATVAYLGKRNATVTISAFTPIEREAPISIVLVQALVTADKMDWIIQKAVELGVSGIAPISTARATLKLDADRAEKRYVHWQAVAIAACEQCGRNRVPAMQRLQTMDQWLSNHQVSCVLLHPLAKSSLLASVEASKPIALLVGPEGGFADDEIARAVARGAKQVKFGPRTLRSETAGLAAIAALSARFGDLGEAV